MNDNIEAVSKGEYSLFFVDFISTHLKSALKLSILQKIKGLLKGANHILFGDESGACLVSGQTGYKKGCPFPGQPL